MALASFSGNPIVLVVTSLYFLADYATDGFGLDYSVEKTQVDDETKNNDDNEQNNEN
jgi:hypothetical protein